MGIALKLPCLTVDAYYSDVRHVNPLPYQAELSYRNPNSAKLYGGGFFAWCGSSPCPRHGHENRK